MHMEAAIYPPRISAVDFVRIEPMPIVVSRGVMVPRHIMVLEPVMTPQCIRVSRIWTLATIHIASPYLLTGFKPLTSVTVWAIDV